MLRAAGTVAVADNRPAIHGWAKRQASVKVGGGTVWWGEAADEAAREDARPTESCKMYHYLKVL